MEQASVTNRFFNQHYLRLSRGDCVKYIRDYPLETLESKKVSRLDAYSPAASGMGFFLR